MFFPLHVKSDYSLGYGTSSIEELVRAAVSRGYHGLALTDLENLYGQVRFHRQCRLAGVRPITGVEFRRGFDGRREPGSRSGRVVLLAQDLAGYRTLCHLVGIRRGAIPLGLPVQIDDGPASLVAARHEGLFVLTDTAQLLQRLVAEGVAPELLGLLVVRPGDPSREREDLGLARKLGVAPVADLDCVFTDRKDHPLHLLQLAIRKQVGMNEVATAPEAEGEERWLRPRQDAEALFSDLPEALAAVHRISGQCNLDLCGDVAPAVVTPPSPAAEELLRARCETALETMCPPNDDAWLSPRRNRLERELETIERLGFSPFMAQVAEILDYCRSRKIPAAVRGSAVSSLALHLLGGSPVDPVAEGLLFERFLHERKSAWPDVDLDLPWHRRDEVIDFVYRRFGHDHVAMVSAHHTFRYRSALREGLKAWGARPALIDTLSRALPPEELGVEEVDFLDLAAEAPAAETEEDPLRTYEKAPVLREILPLIRRLVGRPHHIAVHPGGIVIDRRALADFLPLERAPKGVVVTQYDLVAVAQLGLVKIDLLGNRFLSEFEQALQSAVPDGSPTLGSIPREDPETLSLVDRAATIGCFQLESPAMRSLLTRLPVRRQADLTAALALIRPGAASGDVKASFIRRARGEEAADAVFPQLADRLAETHGLLLYEEDVMELLARNGGITLGEADEFRRGIVKSGGDGELLAAVRREFLEKAGRNLGKGAVAGAARAWATAARFAAYSFNKAHAASYALLAYHAAYLKTHHPLHFACALLNHHQGLYPLRVEANEMARTGIRILPPGVNRSGYRSMVVEGESGAVLQVGLDKVKGLSRGTAMSLLKAREKGEFQTLSDFLGRVPANARELAALVMSGACDGLIPLGSDVYPFVHEAVLKGLKNGAPPETLEKLHVTVPGWSEQKREQINLFQALTRVRNELLYLEMSLTAHPMQLLREEAVRYRCRTIDKARALRSGATVRVAVVVAAMKRVPIREGIIEYLSLEDETGLIEAVVLPERYRLLGERVTTPGPFLAEGRIRRMQGAVHLEIFRLDPFHERSDPFAGE